MISPSGIVAMTGGGPHAWIMINTLREKYGDFPVIVEEPEDSQTFWTRRRKLLGLPTVFSMQAARIPIRLTKFGAQARINELIEAENLRPEPEAGTTIVAVPNVNSAAAHDVLERAQPKAVFVVSTRILKSKTLSLVDAAFINYHSGINPAYRGMFGGYFALANREPQHFGATVHLVDRGVDTGEVLYQSQVTPHKADTFHTYIWTMAAGSRDIVLQAMDDALNDKISPQQVDLPSKQYFAPTLGGYISTGLFKGVW